MPRHEVQKITVLGTGNMGPGMAMLFAQHGYPVTIWAHSSAGRRKAERDCSVLAGDLERSGAITNDQAAAIARSITVTEDLGSAVSEADWISESIVENLEIKREVIGQVQKSRHTQPIIASNTSTLLPSSIQSNLPSPERVLVAHFWNPAHLVPLVEICGSDVTDPEAVETTATLLKRVGKDPVVMKKEILGFIGNRLMHAMYREALRLIADGIIDAEGIDRVVLSSFGPRFANLGPMEYLDYIGLDHIKRIQGYLYDDLDAAGGVTPEIERLNREGALGVKTGLGLYDWKGKDPDDVRARRDAEFLRRLSGGDA